MTWPKHKNPRPNRAAKAPYNFVPLPEKVLPAGELCEQNTYHTDRHTGWLDCVLTTSSPLYVRCGVLPSQFDQVEAKDLPEFFYTNPDTLEPVIPGSSLRGMLRALVEIVSYSKFQPVTDELKATFRAVARQYPLADPYQDALGKYGSKVKAGYLKQRGEQWSIRPAHRPSDLGLPGKDSYLKVKERHIPDDAIPGLIRLNQRGYQPQYHDVSFDTQTRQDRNNRLYVAVVQIGPRDAGYRHRGVLVCSGNMLETSGGGIESPRKNHALVLEPNDKARTMPIGEQTVKDYVDSLTDFQKEPPFDKRRGCLVEGRPVFYVEDRGQVVMFGHCPNFRVPARLAGQERAATPLDFVPEALRNSSETDLAEAMFGYVEPDEKAKRPVNCAGRVFVSDATLKPGQSDIWFSDKPIPPKILASPKPTTFQHYLVQTDDNRSRLHHYASHTPEETVIRGHKLYWHKGDVKRRDFEEDKPVASGDTQHTKIKPIRSGVEFSFHVHFENLSDVELGALLWLLEMAADDGYRLKLGMAKPLGLGAVKVESTLHLTDRPTRYAHLFEGDGWAIGERSDADDVWKDAVQDFEQRVLNDRELNPRGATALKDVERIQMLCFMLFWPGPEPAPEKTCYLEIEHPQHGNEYKERLVLPTPAGILQSEQTHTPISPQRLQSKSEPPPPLPQVVSHPASVEEIKKGDLLEGRVEAVESNRVLIDLGVAKGSMGLTQLDNLVRRDKYFKEMYPGEKPTARVLQERGGLEEDLYGTKMRVRVRKVEQHHNKVIVKVEFVAWLIERSEE